MPLKIDCDSPFSTPLAVREPGESGELWTRFASRSYRCSPSQKKTWYPSNEEPRPSSPRLNLDLVILPPRRMEASEALRVGLDRDPPLER